MTTEKVSAPMIEPGALTGLPLTTKGDLVVHDEAHVNVRLPAGGPGQVLAADPGSPLGLAWLTPSSGARILGEILMGAFPAAPALWLACDGAAVSRAVYSELYAVIGDVFGAGDGSTTFNLPDLRGRSPMGQGTGGLRLEILAVDEANNRLLVPTQDLTTGTAVIYTSTGAPIPPLVSGTTYYWVRSPVNSVTQGKLAQTRANAMLGVTYDLTGPGAGTHAIEVAYASRAVGQARGEEAHTLSLLEIPLHSHSGAIAAAPGGFAVGSTAQTANTGGAGGSEEHNNVHPVAVVGFFIYAGV